MYTRRSIQPSGEPLRLPEHYSGVTFSRTPPSLSPTEITEEEDRIVQENAPLEDAKEKPMPITDEKAECEKKQSSLLGLSGREDILLLILALLLLDDEEGDDMLAYILLGLLVLG